MKSINPSALPLGQPLPADVYYADGRLFAGAGEVIAPFYLSMAKARLADGLRVGDD